MASARIALTRSGYVKRIIEQAHLEPDRREAVDMALKRAFMRVMEAERAPVRNAGHRPAGPPRPPSASGASRSSSSPGMWVSVP
jgi:hypothetical protein